MTESYEKMNQIVLTGKQLLIGFGKQCLIYIKINGSGIYDLQRMIASYVKRSHPTYALHLLTFIRGFGST